MNLLDLPDDILKILVMNTLTSQFDTIDNKNDFNDMILQWHHKLMKLKHTNKFRETCIKLSKIDIYQTTYYEK